VPLRSVLTSPSDQENPIRFLRDTLTAPVIEQMNRESLLVRYTLYSDMRIPTNQRNLTDVRTRMGGLLEYDFAYVAQNYIESQGISDVSVNYVIANRYPDLEVRANSGAIGVRFEVKSIQTVAEEKSANFDTLIKDIRKGSDYVLAFIWEWQETADGHKRPYILDHYLFDAYDLAQMRDTYWLGSPPSGMDKGRQGFDLTFAVTYSNGYKKEENNLGKIMRIFPDPDKFSAHLPAEVRNSETLQEYQKFCDTVLRLGYDSVLDGVAFGLPGGSVARVGNIDDKPYLASIRSARSDLCLVAGLAPGQSFSKALRTALEKQAQVLGVNHVLQLNSKFAWKLHKVSAGTWQVIEEAGKPAGISAALLPLTVGRPS